MGMRDSLYDPKVFDNAVAVSVCESKTGFTVDHKQPCFSSPRFLTFSIFPVSIKLGIRKNYGGIFQLRTSRQY